MKKYILPMLCAAVVVVIAGFSSKSGKTNMPLSNYEVVNAINAASLSEKVMDEMTKGWQPCGGVSGFQGFHQAMVK